jgi:hypothetical protein
MGLARLSRSPPAIWPDPVTVLRVGLPEGKGDHRLHGLLEIGAAIDGRIGVEPDGLVRGVDHRLGGMQERLQGCCGQPTIAGLIGLEIFQDRVACAVAA